MPLLVALGLGVVAFAATNVDDLLLLLGFFADRSTPRWSIVAGQFLGVGILYGVSVAASFVALVIPTAFIGLLGLAPVTIGVLTFLRQRRRDAGSEKREWALPAAAEGNRMGIVALVTVANGGDNVATYTPLFAVHSAREVAAIGIAFALMTALWCAGACWLVGHRLVGRPIGHLANGALPFILIGLGATILWKSEVASLIGVG